MAKQKGGYKPASPTQPVQLFNDPLASLLSGMPNADLYSNMSDYASPQEPAQAPQMPDLPQAAPAQPDNAYTPYDDTSPKNIADSIAPDNTPIDIKGDPWKAHKLSALAGIANFFLGNALGRGNDERNLSSAMLESLDNPGGIEANRAQIIRRIAQFKPQLAETLMEKLIDDKRQQGSLDRQNKVFDLKLEETVRDRVAGLLGTITPKMDDATKARIIQRAKTYATGKGFSDIADSIPTDANQIDIDTIRYGEIPVAKQESLKRSDRRLDQADVRLGETGRHNRATEAQAATNEEGRNARHENPAPKPQARSLMTKYGPGVISKDGTKLLVTNGGKHYLYIHTGKNDNGSDNWTPAGEVQVK
jgi:hypothetical protein